MKKNSLYSVSIVLLLGACGTNVSTYDVDSLDSTALSSIKIESYKKSLSTLASDEFMGRKPFTAGDTLTVNYIEQQYKALGLEKGNGNSYFQEVPLIEVTSIPNKELTFKGVKSSFTVQNLDDYVISTRQLQDIIDVPHSSLLFAGFGIVAPEYGWNDYEGLDVKGKTVVVMVSDPGRYSKNLFKADTMTYYGRWQYKYEEAGRQGAAGVLLIHDAAAASYGWDVVRAGWGGSQLHLDSNSDQEHKTKFEGWITAETTKKLLENAGYSLSLLEQAKQPGFKGKELNSALSVTIQNKFRRSKSNNVIAKITGSQRPEETIIYTAHWDHLGIGEASNGDSIYNGAIDNAAGVAALFEIAKAYQSAKIKPERSIIFMALTGEEEGLLGSAYYTNNPIYPIAKTVANINMDAFSPLGATRDVSIVGIGQSELEDYVARSAVKFGRVIKGEKNPSSGGFYRSDHFSFVKKGIPGLFMGSGADFISTDTTAIKQRKAALDGRYHTVSDELNEHWDFEGILADIRLFFDIGYTLSMDTTFPLFKPKSEFRELGEKRLSK